MAYLVWSKHHFLFTQIQKTLWLQREKYAALGLLTWNTGIRNVGSGAAIAFCAIVCLAFPLLCALLLPLLMLPLLFGVIPLTTNDCDKELGLTSVSGDAHGVVGSTQGPG